MNDLTSVVDIALMVEKEDTVELRVDRKACVRKTLAATNLITRSVDIRKISFWRVLPTALLHE